MDDRNHLRVAGEFKRRWFLAAAPKASDERQSDQNGLNYGDLHGILEYAGIDGSSVGRQALSPIAPTSRYESGRCRPRLQFGMQQSISFA
jgi:hypothetical protein